MSPDMAGMPDLLAVPVSTTVLLLTLAFSAGTTDAFAYVALGGVFTGNMPRDLVNR